MGQECRRCRLINPDEALRCDCGYDFATHTMKQSYLAAQIVEKAGGPEAILANAARQNIRTGTALVLITGAISGLVTHLELQESPESRQGTYFLFLGGFTLGAILLVRGLNQRRLQRRLPILSPESSGRMGIPGERGYHGWLSQLNADPLALGVRGLALAFASVPATLAFAILGLLIFPEGWYPHILLALPGILAGCLVLYVLGFVVYKLPSVGIVLCGVLGSMCIWLPLFWARTYEIWP
jgi:hypothetical protein